MIQAEPPSPVTTTTPDRTDRPAREARRTARTDGRADGDVSTEESAPGHSGRIAKVERYRIEPEHDSSERDGDGEMWEVFQRDDDGRPLRHVGRVHADDAEAAHSRASRLFGWYAPEVWVCPAAAVTRFGAGGDSDDEPVTPPSGDEARTVEF